MRAVVSPAVITVKRGIQRPTWESVDACRTYVELARGEWMPAPRSGPGVTRRQVFEHAHEPIGIGIRQWAKADGMQRAEDRRGRADAKRERDRRGRGEFGTAREAARTVREVLPEIGDPAERPRIALMLLRLLDAAEGAPGRESRFLRRQALEPKTLFEQREVRRHLPREVMFGTARTNRGHDPQ